jgi:hypothetical protein
MCEMPKAMSARSGEAIKEMAKKTQKLKPLLYAAMPIAQAIKAHPPSTRKDIIGSMPPSTLLWLCSFLPPFG